MSYLEFLLERVFLFFYGVFDSYGVGIVCLSIGVTVILTPFYYLTGILENREKQIRDRLEPFIDKINSIQNPRIRHFQLSYLYKSFNYLPIYSLRSLSSLLIQIPFFIGAYEMLSHFTGFAGVSFLFIKDLSRGDGLLFGINLLPILMTVINFIAAIFMTYSNPKERKQSFVIAVFFLILLYTSPAGLVLYWTFNNFLNALRYFFSWLKENNIKAALKILLKKIVAIPRQQMSIALVFLFALYFAINLLSYGHFDRDNIPIFYCLWLAMYVMVLLKTLNLIMPYPESFKLAISKKKVFAIFVVAVFLIIRMYQDEKTLYLLSVLILLSAIDFKNIKIFSLKDYAKSAGFNICAIIFPATIYIKPNLLYFRGTDIYVYFAILIGFAIVLPILLSVFSRISINKITNLSISFIISIMFLPLIRDSVKFSGTLPLDFIVLFLIVLFLVNLIDKFKKLLVIFFICGAIYAIVAGVNMHSDSKNLDSDSTNKITASAPQELLDLDMKDSASIYLFMHDAFPRKDLAMELGIDYEEVEKLMSDYEFKIYDVYSLADHTRATMASIFDVSDRLALSINVNETAQEINYSDPIFNQWGRAIGGDSFVNILLQAKGYKTWGEGRPSIYSISDKDEVVRLTMNKYGAMPQVLLAIMQGYLDTMLLRYYSDSPAMITAEFANKQNGADKIFAWGHGGPDHSTLNGYGSATEQRWWKPRYYKSIKEMKKELELTISKNPEAIVIVMSDHGPVMLDGAMRFYRDLEAGQIKSIHFRDQYGAFMAIRWPDKKKAGKYDREFYIVQDLFPIVFAYLFDSAVPLKFRIKDTGIRMRGHRFDRGVFYRDFYGE